MKVYLKEIDYTDTKKNTQLMAAFIKFFSDINAEMLCSQKEKGFISIPLHRVFSYYFTRLINTNAMLTQSKNISIKNKQ